MLRAMKDLDVVREALDRLAWQRREGGLSAAEGDEYRRLAEREAELLDGDGRVTGHDDHDLGTR